jgi:hypothetical protein
MLFKQIENLQHRNSSSLGWTLNPHQQWSLPPVLSLLYYLVWFHPPGQILPCKGGMKYPALSASWVGDISMASHSPGPGSPLTDLGPEDWWRSKRKIWKADTPCRKSLFGRFQNWKTNVTLENGGKSAIQGHCYSHCSVYWGDKGSLCAGGQYCCVASCFCVTPGDRGREMRPQCLPWFDVLWTSLIIATRSITARRRDWDIQQVVFFSGEQEMSLQE